MEIRNLDDLAHMIATRDGISMHEANTLVDDCANEINELVAADRATYDEVADIIADYLGLEPDYMDLFIW